MTPRFLELINSLPLQVAITIAKAAALLMRGSISLFVQLPVPQSPRLSYPSATPISCYHFDDRREHHQSAHLLWWQLDR
ncbi:hypothetical protein [Chamaesiphon sp.]|uniref:hypothetical protein n=1 Tax=Chamaesiphon sp. TaxID=2814140 RepID=UPI003593A189